MIEIIPAIDIISGKCVRLTKGDYASVKSYSDDPADIALRFKDAGLNAMVCDNAYIDPHFITFLEYKAPDKLKFARIDAAVDGALKDGDSEDDSVIRDIFKEAVGDEKLTVKTERLKNAAVPAIINVDEIMRRYSEMGQMYGMMEGDPARTLVVNLSNPVVSRIKEMSAEKQKFAAYQIYLLALLSFKKLSTEELNKLIENDLTMLSDFTAQK